MKPTFFRSLLVALIVGLLSAAGFGLIGYQSGQEIGEAIVYDASYDIGFIAAFEQNKDAGYQDGYNMGIIQGSVDGAAQISESEIQVRDSETLEAMNAAIPGSLFLTHLRLERQFLGAGNRVYLSVRNVTNVRWQEILGAPMPGRWVLAGMRFQL